MATEQKKITLYTSHICPWAHRAHIALAELGLEFEEVIIPLDRPREQWYLDEVNPRGLVPALKYGDEVIIESNIVTQFLADGFSARDGHKLQPTTGTPEAALTIARQFFFIDTFVAKVASQLFKVGLAETEDAKRTVTDDIISSVKNELTPLLKGTAEGKFFGGSEHPTLVEVNTGSFLLRLYEFADTGYFPKGWKEELEGTGVFHEWAQRVTALPSVRGIWNKENVLKAQERKLKVLREKQQQAK